MQHLINTKDYSAAELITFGVGCFCWIIVYFYTLKSIKERQFIEIPLITVCGNIIWEFLWSWVFKTDMGSLFQWGYRIWFFMDCLIVYGLFRYGYKQISIPLFRDKAKALILLAMLAWLPLLYFYIKNYDAPISHMGAYSGYILNVMISALYIPLVIRLNDWKMFSYPAAWYKAIGNLLINIFCFLHFSDWFLLSLCILTSVLDAYYLYLLHVYRRTIITSDAVV
ncbi:MAG: hypothetical protein JWQ25_1146 [Daejeonella sp.]|nr:hypothetical protein [Daejeonella sp.]